MSLQKSIALLLTAFPITENDPDQELLVKVYEVALSGVSEAAAKYACMAYVQGGVTRKTHAFRPTPAEVAEFAKRRQASLDSTQQTLTNVHKTLKALPSPNRPDETARQAHVQAVLGRKVDYRKSVNPPAMLAADLKRPKPWHDKAELRESMGRINEYLEEQGVPLHPKEAEFIDKHNPEDRTVPSKTPPTDSERAA